MPEQDDKFKLYFFYFLVVSIVILLIVFVIILGTFWSFWSKIWRIEEFYSQKNQSVAAGPTISRFDPYQGNINAKVTIIEYSDFFCPACKNLNTDLQEIEKQYGTDIKIVFKSLPVLNQLESKKAAISAYCAGEQNKFWEYKDLLFENNNILNDQAYLTLATSLGLSQQSFSACLTSQKYDALINNNLTEALKLQIISIPTVYVNNQKMEDYITVDSLKKIIDKNLNQ